MSIIIFLLVLGILIFSHELGHFLVAKWCGFRVDEFGLGFPPRIFSFKRSGTVYSINIIPFGGFVKIYGEDPEGEKNEDPGSVGKSDETPMYKQGKWRQAATLSAGVIFNWLLAWLLIVATLVTIGLPIAKSSVPDNYELRDVKLVIVSTLPGSPAAQAGLESGDIIVAFRSRAEPIRDLSPEAIGQFTSSRAGQEMVISYIRQTPGVKDTINEVGAVPVTGLVPEQGERAAIGVALESVGTLKLPIFSAIIFGTESIGRFTYLTAVGLFNFFAQIFHGETAVLSQVSGPIGIASLTGSAAALGLGHLIFLMAVISINLALLNLLPIPALDGGRLLFLLIEAVKGSPIKPKFVRIVNLISFILLLLLMALVTYGDILKLLK